MLVYLKVARIKVSVTLTLDTQTKSRINSAQSGGFLLNRGELPKNTGIIKYFF